MQHNEAFGILSLKEKNDTWAKATAEAAMNTTQPQCSRATDENTRQ
jgi:hypothetical protein